MSTFKETQDRMRREAELKAAAEKVARQQEEQQNQEKAKTEQASSIQKMQGLLNGARQTLDLAKPVEALREIQKESWRCGSINQKYGEIIEDQFGVRITWPTVFLTYTFTREKFRNPYNRSEFIHKRDYHYYIGLTVQYLSFYTDVHFKSYYWQRGESPDKYDFGLIIFHGYNYYIQDGDRNYPIDAAKKYSYGSEGDCPIFGSNSPENPILYTPGYHVQISSLLPVVAFIPKFSQNFTDQFMRALVNIIQKDESSGMLPLAYARNYDPTGDFSAPETYTGGH